MFDAQLLSILACPTCRVTDRSTLEPRHPAALACTSCDMTFEVHPSGIPRLFASERIKEELQCHAAHWDDLNKNDYDQTLEANRTLLDTIDSVSFQYTRGKVLEIGCGAGRFLDRLAKRGVTDFVGSDISMGMLRGAVAKGFKALVNAPGETLPFQNGQFDSVFATYSVFKYIDRERGHSEVTRVLRPNGYFVFDLLSYWPGIVDHIWWNYLSKGKFPPTSVAGDYTLAHNMRNARLEVEYATRAGFRLVEMKSVRYLPFLRGRVKQLGFWPGYLGAKLGCNTVFVFQKP